MPKRVTYESRIIGANIRALRKEAGLSQHDIAAIMNVTFQQIQKYERGENRLPVEKLYRLKNHLGVPFASFFTGIKLADPPGAPWPQRLTEKLLTVNNPVLREKIERIAVIMLE